MYTWRAAKEPRRDDSNVYVDARAHACMFANYDLGCVALVVRRLNVVAWMESAAREDVMKLIVAA